MFIFGMKHMFLLVHRGLIVNSFSKMRGLIIIWPYGRHGFNSILELMGNSKILPKKLNPQIKFLIQKYMEYRLFGLGIESTYGK